MISAVGRKAAARAIEIQLGMVKLTASRIAPTITRAGKANSRTVWTR